jgi:hypothetical protein
MIRPSVWIALSGLLLATAAPALDPVDVAKWSSDLAFAHDRILDTHPDPFAHETAEQLDARFAALRSRLEQLQPYEAVVGSLGDGHSRLTLPIPDSAGFVEGHSTTALPADVRLRFHTLPIRLGLYEEGLIVERIEARHSDLAGSKVTAIGGVPVDQALEKVAPVVRHDNPSQLEDLLPMHLVIPEVLAAVGLSTDPGRARFELETPAGERTEVELLATDDESTVRWASALADSPREALSLLHVRPGMAPRRGHFEVENWWTRVPSSRALYVQLNRIEDSEDLPLYRLADQLQTELAKGDVDRLVLDLRWNWGGDDSLSQPLLHALISSPVLRGPAALVVLVGRGTFSAAMMLAVDLERHLRPLFVGEPTGARPNHYGDSRRTTLPNSGLTLRISTLYWQVSDPRDRRVAITPQLAAPPRWQDLVAGRDPALDLALAPQVPIGDVSGSWVGRVAIDFQEAPARLVLGAAGRELRVEGLDGSLRLDPLDAPGDRLRFSTDSPFGPLELVLLRMGDRLAGQLVAVRHPWERFPLGLDRAH